MAAGWGSSSAPSNGARGAKAPDTSLSPYVEKIPGTLIEFKMVPVPAGSVTINTPEGPRQVEVGPYWMGETEVKWDAYDVFVYGLDDQEVEDEVDAISRPSDPYVLPGENSGHKGYPAMAVTRKAARHYARWLSAKTDRTYRLPTEAEWTHACKAGVEEQQDRSLDEHAWHAGNAEGVAHRVGTKAPNALGLHDLRGNVAEWVFTEADSTRREVRGGSFENDASEVNCEARMEQTSAWKEQDPQLPKSEWWLSDAPFVGFRIVRVP